MAQIIIYTRMHPLQKQGPPISAGLYLCFLPGYRSADALYFYLKINKIKSYNTVVNVTIDTTD